MNSFVEKLTKEIESLQNQFETRAMQLLHSRGTLKENQDSIKTLESQYHELGKQQQKIIEQLDKAKKQVVSETIVVQHSEKSLEQINGQIQNNKQRIEQHIKNKEEEKRAQEAFDKSPEGMAYQEFLRQSPQNKNTDRNHSVEWAYYLIRRAQQFQEEWKTYLKVNNNGSECCFVNGASPSRTFTFPEFPQIQVGPHESDGNNKVNNARSNFHRCYQWFENNKQLLEQYKASQKAYYEKQQQETEKAKVERQKRSEEEEKKSAIFREAVIKLFLEKVGNTMTVEEADAVLGKFHEPQNTQYMQVMRGHHIDTSTNVYLWKNVFKQDSLLAMKVCNRFAQQNEIRVEDAMALFKEYAGIKYHLPKEYDKQPQNTIPTRTYIRDVNC